MHTSKYNVLVIDDDDIARELLIKILCDLPVRVSALDNAIDALSFLETHTVDLVITDIVMPVMDGFALTSKIRASQESSFIPVVVITALSEPELISKAFDTGATDYISKPLHREEVLARVSNILHRKSAEDKWIKSKSIITLQNEQLKESNKQLHHMISDLQNELSITKDKVTNLIKAWSEASTKKSNDTMLNADLLQQVADLKYKIANLKSKNTELNAILENNKRDLDLL